MKSVNIFLDVTYAKFKSDLVAFERGYISALEHGSVYINELIYNIKESDKATVYNVGSIKILPKNIKSGSDELLVEVRVEFGSDYSEVEIGCVNSVITDLSSVEHIVFNEYIFIRNNGERSIANISNYAKSTEINSIDGVDLEESYVKIQGIINETLDIRKLRGFKRKLGAFIQGDLYSTSFNQSFSSNTRLSIVCDTLESIQKITVKLEYSGFTAVNTIIISCSDTLNLVLDTIIKTLSKPVLINMYEGSVLFNLNITSSKKGGN